MMTYYIKLTQVVLLEEVQTKHCKTITGNSHKVSKKNTNEIQRAKNIPFV